MTQINNLSPEHKGEQPVRVLIHNILSQFEETNPFFIELSRALVENLKLQPRITYHINNWPIIEKVGEDGQPQSPYLNSNNKIVIHETFLSYVWCISYSLLVLYDENVAKISQNQVEGKPVHVIDLPKIEKAKELFNYAKSLIVVFSEWDKNELPNPELYTVDDKFYIERANGLFVYAMNFILCHEFAHVEKEHTNRLLAGPGTKSHILAFEKEADERAIELILLGTNDVTKASTHFGILIGLCSFLFFKGTVANETHPDTDDRITTFVEKIDPPPSNAMWGVAALAFKLWDDQFAKYYHWPKEIGDLKELFYYVKKQIQSEK